MRAIAISVCVFAMTACTFGARPCDSSCPGQCVAGFCVEGDAGTQGGGGGGGTGGGGVQGGGAQGGGTTGGGNTTGGGSSTGGGTATGGGGMTGGGGTGGTGGGGSTACMPACLVGDECIAGQCVEAALKIVPGFSTLPVGYLAVTMQGAVTRLDGGSAAGVTLPPDISFLAPELTFQPNSLAPVDGDGGFSMTYLAAGSTPTSVTAMVRLSFARPDGGLVSVVAPVVIDTRPPTVTLEVDSLSKVDGGVRTNWSIANEFTDTTPRRDETAVVRLIASHPLLAQPILSYGDQPIVTANSVACSSLCPSMSECTCYQVELYKGGFRRVTGVFPITIRGKDLRGVDLVAPVAGSGFITMGNVIGMKLTRIRWRVTPSVGSIRVAPAIVPVNGNIYFGDSLNSTNGNLFAYQSDGTPAWTQAVGSVTSVAVAADAGLLYFNANGTAGGVLSARGLATGAISMAGWTSTGCTGAVANQKTNAALGLVDLGTGALSAAAIMSAGGAQTGFCLWDTSRPNSRQNMEADDLGQWPPSDTQPVSNVVLSNNGLSEISYPARMTDGGTVIRIRPFMTSGSLLVPTDVGPIPMAPLGQDNGIVPRTTTSSHPTTYGAGTAIGATGFYVVPQGTLGAIALTTSTSKAVVDRMGRMWLYANGDLQAVQTNNMSSGVFGTLAISFPKVLGSPVLTQDSGGAPDKVFVVGSASGVSSLGVASQVMEPNQLWSDLLPINGDVSASPAFDCNRLAPTPAARATGILYIATHNGELLSVIVDSPRLDTMAPWPKFQKDSANSGNTALTLPDGCP